MSWLMEPIYHVISWVLLRWHEFWAFVLPGDGRFLGTSWEWVLGIVFLVVTVRIVLFPIFVKQIKSQRAMQALAPKIRELQAKHKGDQQTLREEMMKLYQTEKVNPLMGCLPMFLQIPVFFGLFHVLRYINPLTTQPEKPDGPPKTLYGWTEQLFDGAASADLFTAPIPATFADGAAKLAALGSDGGPAVKIVAAVLVLMMMFTTFATSRQMILKTGWQAEPQQRMIQKLMLYGIPVSLLLSGWYFPIGVVIYWVTQNLISLAQQQWVLRKYPPVITTPEAPKTARERAAAATKKEPNAIARFFLVLPKPAGPAAPKQGPLARLTAKLRPGTATPVGPVEPAPRSLAPRPGAKPRATTPTTDTAAPEAETPKSATEPATTEPLAQPKPASAKKAVPGRKAVPGKAVPAKADGAKVAKAAPGKAAPGKATSAPKASPTQPSAAEVNDAAAPATPAAAGRTGGGGARAGGGGRTGGSPRKAAPRRKGGQPARKGSGKR